MVDINLSKAVRSNLTSLQNTASLMAKTSDRLSTGNKVNSALDNPTNFFTASSLNSRASDLNQLMDSMANGIKTIEAADNGLSAITKNLESMQSTLRQARQDKSFQTQSYTIDTAAIGTASLKNLSFSGGAVGATAVNIALNSMAAPAGATALTGAAGSFGALAAGNVVINGQTVAIRGEQTAAGASLTGASANFGAVTGGNITINGSANIAIRGDQTASATTLTGTPTTFAGLTGPTNAVSINGQSVNVRGNQSAVASTTTGVGGADLSASQGGDIVISGGGLSSPLTVTLGNSDTLADVRDAINLAAGSNIASLSNGQLQLSNAAGTGAFTVADASGNSAGTTAALGLDTGTASNVTGSAAFTATATTIAADLNGAVSGLTASVSNGAVALSLASGADITVGSGSAATAIFGSTLTSTNGTEAFDATATTVAADISAGITANSALAGTTVTVTNGNIVLGNSSGATITLAGTGATLDSIGFASANRTASGTTALDADATSVAADINGAAITGVTASVVNGQVQLNSAGGSAITVGAGSTATAIGFGSGNLSVAASGTPAAVKTVDQLVSDINGTTALQGKIRATNDNGKLRIENLSTQDLDIAGIGGGKLDGTSSVSEIVGNSVRSDLAKQFNDLRDTLDKLADDASFNGINLLRGDNLKITFNETGTSAIDIIAKNGEAINSTNLNIATSLTAADLDTDTGIDAFIDQIKGALNQVRSQASAFGSNLSIVQNRQDFTKAMINTLETGAGNLTLADMNQEAANMMALQTRQSLASSTLSMANQADQSVLQLLR